MPSLTIDDLARAFGVEAGDLAVPTRERAERHCLDYRLLEQAERDQVILNIIERIDGQGFSAVGAHRDQIWQSAWDDVRARYRAAAGDITTLNPSFVGGGRIVRVNGDYAEATDPRFELSAFEIFRDWLFRRWLGPFDRVLEFGCGSGFNLTALAELYPDKSLIGLDWAPASVALLGEIATDHGFALSGQQFDFFHPEDGPDLKRSDAVMTFCALEQVGDRFEPFLDYLLRRPPGLCLHMEPTLEHYDPARLPDYLAIRYHRHRRYLNGYLTRLRELEAAGRLRILNARRLGWGSLYHECYSLTVWEPQ